jgi:hypothetical protein
MMPVCSQPECTHIREIRKKQLGHNFFTGSGREVSWFSGFSNEWEDFSPASERPYTALLPRWWPWEARLAVRQAVSSGSCLRTSKRN